MPTSSNRGVQKPGPAPKASFAALLGSDKSLLIILAALFLLSRIPAMLYMPFVQDESLYSVMIEEQAAHPTLIPTLFGYPVSWKPALFFWTYAALSRVQLPIELAYRLPSLAFGLLTVIIIGLLVENVIFRSVELRTVRRWGMQS